MSADHLAPDTIAPGQLLWFVGTAPSRASAAARAYYAHPGNRFWRALHESGLTSRLYLPHEFRELAELGIGLTDFCKTRSGVDAQIPREAFDPAALRDKVRLQAPAALAFTSKAAASLWFQRPTSRIAYGRDAEAADPIVFVLTSPSGLASGSWSLAPWVEVARWARPGTEHG
jgi:double-stranded uracil-DNA glycosylase